MASMLDNLDTQMMFDKIDTLCGNVCGAEEENKAAIESKARDGFNPHVEGIVVMECDYDKNPHALYIAIKDKKWLEAHKLLQDGTTSNPLSMQKVPKNKVLAQTWIVRRKDDGSIKWRIHPLHAAIISNAPAYLLERLVEVHPVACQLKDDQGNIPLHLAYRDGLAQEKIDILAKGFPEGEEMENNRGRTPSQYGASRSAVDTEPQKKESTDAEPSPSGEEASQDEQIAEVSASASAAASAAQSEAEAEAGPSSPSSAAEEESAPEEVPEAKSADATPAPSMDKSESAEPAASADKEEDKPEEPVEEDKPEEPVEEEETPEEEPSEDAGTIPEQAPEETKVPTPAPSPKAPASPEVLTPPKKEMKKSKSIFKKLGFSKRKSKKYVEEEKKEAN